MTAQPGTWLLATQSPPPAISFLGNVAIIHASTAATGERYALVEVRGQAGHETPLHVHHDDDEGFYVLEGRLRVHAGWDVVVLRPGDFFLAEKRVPHLLMVEPGQPARWLVTSGGGFDRFVMAVAGAGELPAGDIAHIAMAFGIEILGPPGTRPGSFTGTVTVAQHQAR
jgi:quercetin dioxygenase-like cupin family protein